MGNRLIFSFGIAQALFQAQADFDPFVLRCSDFGRGPKAALNLMFEVKAKSTSIHCYIVAAPPRRVSGANAIPHGHLSWHGPCLESLKPLIGDKEKKMLKFRLSDSEL